MKPKFEIENQGHDMYYIHGDIKGIAESFIFESLKRFKYDFSFFTPKGIFHRITWNGNMTITSLRKLELHIIEQFKRAVEEDG